MDYEVILFWLVCFSCGAGLVATLRQPRTVGRGWAVVLAVILLLCLIGQIFQRSSLIYIATGLWLLFVLLPGLLSRVYQSHLIEQRYSAARRLAWIIKCVHPADGWREQLDIVRAIERAHKGDLAGASQMLAKYEAVESRASLSAVMTLFRLTNQWEKLIAWENEHRQELQRVPQFLHNLLRARGETADVAGLVELFDRNRNQIGKQATSASRDLCRLMLFAFCGKRNLVEHLLAGSLASLPLPIQKFWLATADSAAGDYDGAQRQFELLLPEADPITRGAIERRLSLIGATDSNGVPISVPSEPRSAFAERVIASVTLEQYHDESFGATPSLFSKRARATQFLVLSNLLMFAAEILFGGSNSLETLLRLGALYAPAVRAGEWWRLGASIFLHVGPLHLAMNLIALWMLGPFTEFALGFRRFLFVYLLAGIGSMGVVLTFASGPHAEQVTVGASGSVMGLVGATAALMLRGWLRQRASSAKRRFTAMFTIIAMQTAFDAVIPQVSMTAHLSGAIIGFLATLILSDRLARPDQRRLTPGNQPTPQSAKT